MTNNIKRIFNTEVIMATYNNASYTRTTLEGFTRQSEKNFSITVADDGSDKDIHELAISFENRLAIRHIWQQDKGYRRAGILNKAIATSKADYIIFIDNDCIPHRDFIKDHIECASAMRSVTGRRVNLGPEISQQLVANINNLNKLENPLHLLYYTFNKKLRDGERGIRLPKSFSTKLGIKKRGLLGSNMAVWRDDLLKVNGFDSSFSGYGAEETDLQWRLEAHNIEIRPLINRAIQYHLYHEQKSVTSTNFERIQEKKDQNLLISPAGIKEALKEIAGKS